MDKPTRIDALRHLPMLFGQHYLPHHFRDNSPDFHEELMLGSLAHQYIAIAAPRGFAKSTILCFLKPMHDIMFKKRRFIVIISNTFKKAAKQLETIKTEFRENVKLMTDFRGMTITKDAEGDSEFRHPDGFKTNVMCFGVDQLGSARGIKFGAYRPDLIIGDDMENDELVRSPERRKQLLEDFNTVLKPLGDKGTQYVFIGTILHDDSLLAKLVSKDHYPEYYKEKYQARMLVDGQPASLWPEKKSLEELNQLEKDDPSMFAKEYMNDPVSGASARFKKEDFRYWSMDAKQFVLFDANGAVTSKGWMHDCKAAIACDLAWSERRDADSTVLMPLFVTPSNDLLVDSFIAEKGMRPDKFANLLFDMEKRLRFLTGGQVPVGFEKAMLEKVMQWILAAEMRKRDHWLVKKELKWETDKITRIETVLQPRYAAHSVYHKRGMGDLEHELLRFPSGTHDDIIDALQGAVRLLEFPKGAKAVTPTDSDFDWWRSAAINKNKPQRGIASRFTRKGKGFGGIPFTVGPMGR